VLEAQAREQLVVAALLQCAREHGVVAKWSSIAPLPRPVTNTTRSMPARASSSTTCCTTGLPPTGSISFGWDFVAGNRRVPRPATGTTAVVTGGTGRER
jgi:hypothetical protein